MVLEIEVKALCDDLNRVEEHLRKMGALFVKEVQETDLYFDHPLRDFEKTDEALRIRIAQTETGTELIEKSFITYKGQKIDLYSKTREEIEIELSDADAATQLLTRLGFRPKGDIKKVRRMYSLGEFTICLDNVDNVGSFVEVETRGELVEELRDAALKILETLNLTDLERKSYLELKPLG
ncbi:MAG: class IV adenylate cyclase [Theionarchaea archaeon]|nr:class IV adenylate cyclase [Theionarchaea archaeon]